MKNIPSKEELFNSFFNQSQIFKQILENIVPVALSTQNDAEFFSAYYNNSLQDKISAIVATHDQHLRHHPVLAEYQKEADDLINTYKEDPLYKEIEKQVDEQRKDSPFANLIAEKLKEVESLVGDIVKYGIFFREKLMRWRSTLRPLGDLNISEEDKIAEMLTNYLLIYPYFQLSHKMDLLLIQKVGRKAVEVKNSPEHKDDENIFF